MIRAYDIAYLDDAMASIGAMLDYAVNACGEPLELFWNRFLASGVASSLSRANPKYLAGMSGVELARTVADRSGDSLPDAEPFINMGSPEYWTGWAMTYIAWYLNADFSSLASGGVGVMDLYCRYPTLHEADLSKAVRFAQGRLRCHARGGRCHCRPARPRPAYGPQPLAGLPRDDAFALGGR